MKAGIATTWSGNLIVGTRAFAGNPYDGHTLREQVEQATILMQETGVVPKTVFVDLGYRGEVRPRNGSVSSQGEPGRQHPCGTLLCRIQSPLVAEDDPETWHPPFFSSRFCLHQ